MKTHSIIALLAFALAAATAVIPTEAADKPASNTPASTMAINRSAVIPFVNPLPAMRANGRLSGLYNNPELALPGVLTTRDPDLGVMIQQLRNTISNNRRLVFIDGKVLMCNLNWIRDHVHVMKGFCHWEYDLRSFLDFIIETQRADGCFYELIKQMDDGHWNMVDEDCRVFFRDDNLSLVRLEIEADIEYLVVEGAMLYYRVTGDTDWLRQVLPRLEKGINYITSDSKRWDSNYGLVKRAFTIDTWDFTYKPDAGNNRRINADTPMGIMHGDNSGVFQAMNQLAWFNDRLGNPQAAQQWRQRAQTLRENMFKHLWNGKFFIHQLPLGDAGLDQLENVRLSLSNTYDMNRGVTTLEQSRSIIEQYIERRSTTTAFAEWFSIDPPYEKFNVYTPGKYVNGAISPFTAGELAKAAFENGYEDYGWDIISRFQKIIKRDGEIYFLYWPKDGKSQGGGPSAWGAAAIMSAIDEGLAGVKNIGVGYDVMAFSPRWPVTQYNELRYFTGYEKTAKIVDIRYIMTETGMRYHVNSPATEIQAHLLLPKDKTCTKLLVNGTEQTFQIKVVGESRYVDFIVRPQGVADMEVVF